MRGADLAGYFYAGKFLNSVVPVESGLRSGVPEFRCWRFCEDHESYCEDKPGIFEERGHKDQFKEEIFEVEITQEFAQAWTESY